MIEAQRKVLAVVGDTLTVDGAAMSAAEDDLVTPMVLDSTGFGVSEDAMVGLEGELTISNISGLECNVLSAEVSINNNFTARNNIYGTEKICGFLNDQRREVMVTAEIQLDRDNYDLYRRSKNFETADVTLKLKPNNGDAALGRTFTFNFPKVEFNIPSIERPTDGPIVLSFEGKCLSTDASTPDSEGTLTVGPI